MQSLRELSDFGSMSSLSLRIVLAVAICLWVLVRRAQNSPFRLKNLELNLVGVEALDIQSPDGPSLVHSRFAGFEMD
jgi:hypothetical protein